MHLNDGKKKKKKGHEDGSALTTDVLETWSQKRSS